MNLIIFNPPKSPSRFPRSKIKVDEQKFLNRFASTQPLSPPPPSPIYPHHRPPPKRISRYWKETERSSRGFPSFLPSPTHRGIAGVDARGRRIGTRHQPESKYQRPRALMTVLSLLETGTRTTNLLLAISTRHFTA